MNKNDHENRSSGRRRKTRFLLFILLIAFALSVVGGTHAADAGAAISIGGTGGALCSMKEAAKAFHKKHPEISFRFARAWADLLTFSRTLHTVLSWRFP